LMQHDSVTLKVTIAGRMFIRLLVTLNSGDVDQYRAFVEREYAASVLREQSVDEIAASFQALYDETDGLEIFKVYSSQRFSIVTVVKTRRDETLMLAQLTVDDLQPHGILEFRVSEPPESM